MDTAPNEALPNGTTGRGTLRSRYGVLAASGLGLLLGGMLGGSALGVVYAEAMPPVVPAAFVMPPACAPPPMLALAPSEDEAAPDDDDSENDDIVGGELFPEPPAARATGARRGRTAGGSRGALDSAFYRVQPGPVTGYREGRAFGCTVTMVDGKPVEVHTADAFERMRAAATRAGIGLRVISGFRTMEHQRALYAAFRAGRGNLAALPGHSNHQSGHALDLNVTAPGALRWLERHAREFGFRRTVPTETWHWEHW